MTWEITVTQISISKNPRVTASGVLPWTTDIVRTVPKETSTIRSKMIIIANIQTFSCATYSIKASYCNIFLGLAWQFWTW